MEGSVQHTYGSNTTTAATIANTKATYYKNLRTKAGTVTFMAQWNCEAGYTNTGDACLDITAPVCTW
jgi:hypothetical protein